MESGRVYTMMSLVKKSSVPSRVNRLQIPDDDLRSLGERFLRAYQTFVDDDIEYVDFRMEPYYEPSEGELFKIEVGAVRELIKTSIQRGPDLESFNFRGLSETEAVSDLIYGDCVDGRYVFAGQKITSRDYVRSKNYLYIFNDGLGFVENDRSYFNISDGADYVCDGEFLYFKSSFAVSGLIDVSEHVIEATDEQVNAFFSGYLFNGTDAELNHCLSMVSTVSRRIINSIVGYMDIHHDIDRDAFERLVAVISSYNDAVEGEDRLVVDGNHVRLPSTKKAMRNLLHIFGHRVYSQWYDGAAAKASSKRRL